MEKIITAVMRYVEVRNSLHGLQPALMEIWVMVVAAVVGWKVLYFLPANRLFTSLFLLPSVVSFYNWVDTMKMKPVNMSP